METGKVNLKGFSLIELLVVIVIVLILSALSFPVFQKWKVKEDIKNLVYKLSIDIGYGRDYARKNGVRVILAITASTPQYWTGIDKVDPVIYFLFADKNRNGQYDNDDEILSYGKGRGIVVVRNQISKKCFNETGRCITFYPVGPPSIGAVPKKIEFQSTAFSDIAYGVEIRSILGIAEVYRK